MQSIGVEDKDIIWDGSKIIKTREKHTNITDDVIKQIPNILEEPIIVMQSKQKGSRVTMYGEVYDVNGLPVLAVLELMPTNASGLVLDEIKLASTYAKTETGKLTTLENTQKLIADSNILYIDPNKNRTDNWFEGNRLLLPFAIKQYGSIQNISYADREVNIHGKISEENKSGFKRRKNVGG